MVDDPTRWAERNFAEDLAGGWVPVGSERAVKFNLAGAVIKAAGASSREVMRAMSELLCNAPEALETERWRQARAFPRRKALELLSWVIERVESVADAQRSRPNFALSATSVTDAAGAGAAKMPQ